MGLQRGYPSFLLWSLFLNETSQLSYCSNDRKGTLSACLGCGGGWASAVISVSILLIIHGWHYLWCSFPKYYHKGQHSKARNRRCERESREDGLKGGPKANCLKLDLWSWFFQLNFNSLWGPIKSAALFFLFWCKTQTRLSSIGTASVKWNNLKYYLFLLCTHTHRHTHMHNM